jgi:hypothetical protein
MTSQLTGVARGVTHRCGHDIWRPRINHRRSNSTSWTCAYCAARRAVEARRRRIQIAIEAYGHQCTVCGETDRDVLTFDHVADDGAAHRRALGSRSPDRLVKWARDNNWPDTLQLLCANCQLRKQRRIWS